VRFKGTSVLLLVFVVLGGYVYFTEFRGKEEKAKQEEAKKRLFPGDAKDISELTREYEGRTVSAVRKGDKNWEITTPAGLETDSETWEQMASSFVLIEKDETVNTQKTDLAPYGLDKPVAKVTAKLKSGKSQSVQFGAENPRKTLNYVMLDLMPFHPGALIRFGGRFHVMSDLFRRPQDLVQMLVSPIGSLTDKLRMLRVRRDALYQRLCSEMRDAARPTHEVLQAYHFSDAMMTRFFHPFLSGVFLESALATPCWIFELVWGAFCRGATALPRDGMGAIAQHLAAPLSPGTIRLNQAVQHIQGSSVVLESGEQLTADVLVVATDDATAARLRGEQISSTSARGSMTLYFDAPAPPHRTPCRRTCRTAAASTSSGP